MTGSDPFAAGAAAKGAAEAVGKALGASDLETAALLEEAKGSKELQHAAQQRAHRIAVRETLLTKMYSPIAKLLNMRADYFDGNQFAEDMAVKTEGFAESEIVPPRASVAAQAVQGLGFSLDEPDLKEMYLNLLATASHATRSEHAHPAFAGIIGQLSSEEAVALGQILGPEPITMCRIHRTIPPSPGNSVIVNHFVNVDALGITVSRPQQFSVWVDNWVRLGLVEAVYDRFLTAEGVYDWVESDMFYVALKNAFQESDSPNAGKSVLGYDQGFMKRTEFGAQFYKAVMDFETPPQGLPG